MLPSTTTAAALSNTAESSSRRFASEKLFGFVWFVGNEYTFKLNITKQKQDKVIILLVISSAIGKKIMLSDVYSWLVFDIILSMAKRSLLVPQVQ